MSRRAFVGARGACGGGSRSLLSLGIGRPFWGASGSTRFAAASFGVPWQQRLRCGSQPSAVARSRCGCRFGSPRFFVSAPWSPYRQRRLLCNRCSLRWRWLRFSPSPWVVRAGACSLSWRPACATQRPNPPVDPVPFGHWTLRDEAAQRRSPSTLGCMRSAARDISTGQMTRLDLRRREAVPWYVTAGVLAVCGYAVTMLYQIAEARSGVDALPFWALLTPCVALGIYSFSFFFRETLNKVQTL